MKTQRASNDLVLVTDYPTGGHTKVRKGGFNETLPRGQVSPNSVTLQGQTYV